MCTARATRPPLPRYSAPQSRGASRARQPRPAGGRGVPLPSRFQRGQRSLNHAAPPAARPVAAAQRDPAVEQPVRALQRACVEELLVWGKARTQTLLDLAPLARHLPLDRTDAVLRPPAPGTEMELADCRGIPYSLICAGDSLEAAELLFNEQIDLAVQAINTQQGYYNCWLSFVSYTFLHDSLGWALPTTPRLVKTYLWNLLQ
eukprot:678974-Rhodomonas_salina.1